LLAKHPPINLATKFDPDEEGEWIDGADKRVASRLQKIMKEMRDEWVEATKGVTNEDLLIQIGDRMRQTYVPRMQSAVSGELHRLAMRGAIGVLREMGVLEGPMGEAMPADPEAARWLLQNNYDVRIRNQARRIAEHQFNVAKSYLDQQSAHEANGASERLRPQIPTQSATEKLVAGYTPRTYLTGRSGAAKRMLKEAKAKGMDNPRIVAEYSSVMEENTCDPCADADGTRAFVGSNNYNRISPPHLCEGGDRCRCIWSYILPSEKGWEQIVDDLRSGRGSKVEGLLRPQDQ